MTSESPSIELNAVFPSIQELKHMVKKYALYNNFETHTTRSSSTRYVIECKDKARSWQLRAFPDGANEWKIEELSTSHECIGVRGPLNKSANARFVATEMLELFRLQPDMLSPSKKPRRINFSDCLCLITRRPRALSAASPFSNSTEPTCAQSIKGSCSLQPPRTPKDSYSLSRSASSILKTK
jgi:MuDR family transposase